MRRINLDLALPTIIAFGVSMLIYSGGEKLLDYMETQTTEMVYSDTEIGAAATDRVPIVSSIDEMMQYPYFTVHIEDGIHGYNSVYYNETVYRVYELPSGETILVDEYFYHSYYDHDETDDSWSYDSYLVLPIGRIIAQPLNAALIAELDENGLTLTNTSFYVDMRGNFKPFDRKSYESKLEWLCLLIGTVSCIFIRYLMVASGLFAPFIRPRFLKSWKKCITYYGILYYDDERIDRILSYRKKKDMESAAYEFSKLTNTYMDEARNAMTYWDSIYGEGFLPMAKK